jgi:hypothetical protein
MTLQTVIALPVQGEQRAFAVKDVNVIKNDNN